MLIKSKADINKANKNGATPLFIAAQQGNESCLRLLVNQNANINQPTHDDTSPLAVAAEHSHISCLQILLEYDPNRAATVNQTSENGRTALWTAAQQGNGPVVDLLLNAGCVVVQ
jgi:ankyrin repeat protein